MSLSETQSRAVAHGAGPCICLAGPGSGKTTVITERTKYLIEKQKVLPAEILVITFTKAASIEMRERFRNAMGGRYAPVTFGTFHAVFFAILKAAYHYTAENILREEEKYSILREITEPMELEIEDENEFLGGIAGEISLIKNERIQLEHYYSSNCPEDVFRRIYKEYQQALFRKRKLDFDDMLVCTYELLKARPDIRAGWQRRFSYILIDEFQDINAIQYETIRLLAEPENNLFIVGDDDQSIYRFRGARPEIMLNFQKDFPDAKMIQLAENYRSTECIIKGAGRVIAHNTNRFQKTIHGVRGTGEKIAISFFQNQPLEALAVVRKIQDMIKAGREPQEIAVLFRTNTGARIYLEKFMEYNIPFRMRDGLPNIYEHWIANDLFTYIRIAQGSRSRKDFLQIINRPKRYISREYLDTPVLTFEELRKKCRGRDWMEERIDRLEYDIASISRMKPFAAVNYIRHAVGYENYLKEYAQFRRIKPEELYDILDELQEAAKGFESFEAWFAHMEEYKEALQKKSSDQKQEGNAVVFTTLHSAKGLEFPVVFLVDAVEGNMPHRKAATEADVQEERRLFYVGMTRAKDKLYLYYAKERYGQELICSRFVEELRGGTMAKAKSSGEKRQWNKK